MLPKTGNMVSDSPGNAARTATERTGPMTGPMETERRLVIDAAAVLATLAEQPEGVPVPASSVYMALGMDLGRYDRVIYALVQTGMVDRTIDTLTITPAGRA